MLPYLYYHPRHNIIFLLYFVCSSPSLYSVPDPPPLPSPSSLPLLQVDSQIASAFALWASVTDLTFTERSYGAVHMDISFHSRSGGGLGGSQKSGAEEVAGS